MAVGDYDDDGWPDVFVANDGVPNFLFHNEGSGRFSEVGLLAGVSVASDGKPRAGMGTEFADYNGDGRLDLVVTNHEFETHSLFRNAGAARSPTRRWRAVSGRRPCRLSASASRSSTPTTTARWISAIVNGHVIDNTAVFRPGSTHAQRKLLLRNTTGRRFQEVGREAGRGFAADNVGRSLITADVDNDGGVDLLVTNNGSSPELLQNQTGARGGAVIVRVVGTRSNRDGIGARVSVVAGGRTQVREVKSGSSYLGQGDLRVHVGLGDASRIERVDVRWPGGEVQRIDAPPVNHVLTIEEGKGLTKATAFAGRSAR